MLGFSRRMLAGKTLPSVRVFESSPKNAVDIKDVFGPKGKGILIGVPGAFTPGCHGTHIPSFLQNFEALKKKGVETIAVVSVNDVFVMQAWADALQTGTKIRMLADPEAKLVKALDMQFDGLTEVLGNVRSKRFTALVEDGQIKSAEVEPDFTGLSCTLAGSFMKKL
jgi:2-Cys peroxiredoxin 5